MPGVGATTPFRRSPEEALAVARLPAGGAAPKSRAMAAMSTAATSPAGAARGAGAAKRQNQYASCHASSNTSTARISVPGRLRGGGETTAMARLSLIRGGGPRSDFFAYQNQK